MINTQQKCNRCHEKASQIYFCHDIQDGICYACSKIKDKCSICNKKSNIPVNSSSRIIKSSIKQICNICEKSLQCEDNQIATQCKHSICVSCVVKRIKAEVKSCKKAFKNQAKNSNLRLKCNCLLSQYIKLQQFLNNNCFCCGESLKSDNYQQLLYGLKMSRKCKAKILPRTEEDDFQHDRLTYMDIQKLLKWQEYGQMRQQKKPSKQYKQQNQKLEQSINNKNMKWIENGKWQEKEQVISSQSLQYSSLKSKDYNEVDILSCISCGKTLDKYSLLLIEDSFHLCIDCQLKSKSYVSPKQKKTQNQSYHIKSNEINLKNSSTKEKNNEESKRISFQCEDIQQRQPFKSNQFKKSKQPIESNLENICISCNLSFSVIQHKSFRVQSQLSDKICAKCIDMNYEMIEKKQDRYQNQGKSHKFSMKKSRQDMSYSQYLKQIIVLQSPQIIEENPQPFLQKKFSQQNKDRRAIYSVIQEFPQFQQLQIIGNQDQIGYCYNCKIFLCKNNLYDCSNILKKKSMACKMCYLILSSK